MKKQVQIIKVGGKLLEGEEMKKALLDVFSKIPGPKILVHGGGSTASGLCESLGIPVQMDEGRRITDAETLKVATMVYAGLVNKTLVAGLQALGCNAIGLCGADLNLIQAEKRQIGKVNYGFVGDIKNINATALINLIEARLIPVLCAITHNGKGQLLNTNADTIAASIASALSFNYDASLKFCFDKAGVLENPENEASVIGKLDQRKFQKLRQKGMINTGMIPKLHNGFQALKNQVNEVIICGISGLLTNNESKGTTLCLN